MLVLFFKSNDLPAVEGSLDLNTLPFENNLYDAYFYHFDHLGSSNYISNNTGIVSQHTEYLPFGETFVDEHLNSHNTPFKFNAKELDDETGNYYYGARYYNPKWSTWLSVDPLAEKYPNISPYAYCLNNPIRFVDLDGLEPTPYEASLLAADIYNPGSVELVGGWQQSFIYQYNTSNDTKSGLKAAMYERIKQDGSREYAFVYAGTEDLIKDGYNDLTQVLGKSKQYEEASKLAIAMNEYVGSNELTFVGHSLGGGLSNFSSIITGRSSITFNPAWISFATILKAKERGNIKKLNDGSSRTNFIHTSDPLNFMQVLGGNRVNLMPIGGNVYVNGGFLQNWITGHSIDTMIKRLEASGQDIHHKGNNDDTLIIKSPRDF